MHYSIPISLIALFLAFNLLGCGGDDTTRNMSGQHDASEAVVEASPGSLENIGRDPSLHTIDGGIRFTMDNVGKELPHIPAGRAFYYPMALQVTFHAEENSTESLMLNIMGADLKALDYPITLPEERDPNEPLTMANRGATVGWAYMNADGVEWTTGTAKLTLESLSRDGVLKGSFGETSLRGAGQENIVLDDGAFTVQVTSPW